MGNEKNRKQQLTNIARMINQNPEKQFSKTSVISNLMYHEGISKKTAEEYISVLVGAEIVIQDGDILKSPQTNNQTEQ